MDSPDFDAYVSVAEGDHPWAERVTKSLADRGRTVVSSAAVLADSNVPMPDLIGRARNLVVVWSPAARTSEFIKNDIARFEQVGGSADHARWPIFVLVNGGSSPAYKASDVISDLVQGSRTWADAGEVPNDVWAGMTERLNEALDRVPVRLSTKQADEPAMRQANAPPGRPASRVDPTKQHNLFRSVRDIVSHASELKGAKRGAIPTSLLLAAISDRGEVTTAPTWAPAWLRTRCGDDGHKKLLDAARADIDASVAGAVYTDGSLSTFERAVALARRTTGIDEVRVRHLLGALITDPRPADVSAALGALKDLGQDVATLRESYFDFVRGYGDDDAAWGDVLLGAKVEPPVLSGFDADAGSGDDQLDIKPDVLAFAGLIASRTLKPPLSIGLFGEWGSGKTFFMRMLQKQVAYLARQAREETEKNKTRQRDQLFYRRIVQIEFNAWHYAEGNLWASLVQHIFDNLRVIDDRKKRASQELQEPILKRLKVEKAAEAHATREREEAERLHEAAGNALDAARRQFEDKAKELARVSSINVLAAVPTADVMTAVKPILDDLNLTSTIERGLELRATLNEARTLLGRSQATFVPLMTSKDRAERWVHLTLALMAGPAAAFVAAEAAHALDAPQMSSVAAMASGAAALLGTCTEWLKRQLTWVGDQLKRVEDAQRKFDASIEAAQAENVRQIRQAEEQLRLFEADYVAAKQREDEARRRVVDAEARLREATVSRLLTSFIEERANSNDYRKYLGMLALVRNDFERLSDLISEENEDLDGVARDDRSERFPTIDSELADEPQRINRIVLYIDDLDRCPPGKVVDVLQAVHLLLAFPLFVVVVGVDARWVVRSLDARYRELLNVDTRRADGDTRDRDEFSEMFGDASAHDYVEKIFQVPFWVKPMSPEAGRRLVHELLKNSITANGGGEMQPAESEPTAGRSSPPTVESDRRDETRRSGDTSGRNVRDGVTNEAFQGAAATGGIAGQKSNDAKHQSTTGDEATRDSTDLSPESFSITRMELDAMSDLAPLLGRSPRTLKRFVNVYRLMRVGLSPWERQLFVTDAYGVPDYRAVQILLAVDTGAPAITKVFFNTMRNLALGRLTETKKGREISLDAKMSVLIELVDREDLDETAQIEWQRVRNWLGSRLDSKALTDDVVRFARWIPRVSRFSFHAGRL